MGHVIVHNTTQQLFLLTTCPSSILWHHHHLIPIQQLLNALELINLFQVLAQLGVLGTDGGGGGCCYCDLAHDNAMILILFVAVLLLFGIFGKFFFLSFWISGTDSNPAKKLLRFR